MKVTPTHCARLQQKVGIIELEQMNNKVDIFMPMIWADYEKKTSNLSILEHGAYLLLLKEYWNNGGALTCECDANAMPTHMRFYRSCRAMTAEEQAAIDYVLAKFFIYEGGKYHQKKADEELAKAREKRSKAQESANKRWNKSPPDEGANAMPTHMPTQCSTPTPTPTPTNKERKVGSTYQDKRYTLEQLVFSEPDVIQLVVESKDLTPKVKSYLPDCFLDGLIDIKKLQKLWVIFTDLHTKRGTTKSKPFWLTAWREHVERYSIDEEVKYGN